MVSAYDDKQNPERMNLHSPDTDFSKEGQCAEKHDYKYIN